MKDGKITRRDFMSEASLAAGSIAACASAAGAADARGKGILNFNPNMEYRRLGKTGLMVSAVCLGGHWKRVHTMLNGKMEGSTGYSKGDMDDIQSQEFHKNRVEVVSRCIDAGINYVDACAGPEVMAYSAALKGRRQKMYLGYSWHVKESRYAEWRSADKLMQGLDEGLGEAKLEYVDLWRISLPMDLIPNIDELTAIETGAMEALAKAKKQGKARFTGVSSHNRAWLRSLIETYSKQIEVVLFPYTANTKQLPNESVFDAIKQHDVGVFGIKPFADNSLFAGDSSRSSPSAEEDSRRARLAIRYILNNPAITAPIPGLINTAQVDNAVRAVRERRELDSREKAELEEAGKRMWANLSSDHRWLKDWEYV